MDIFWSDEETVGVQPGDQSIDLNICYIRTYFKVFPSPLKRTDSFSKQKKKLYVCINLFFFSKFQTFSDMILQNASKDVHGNTPGDNLT